MSSTSRALLACLLCLWASPVLAQHYCDTTPTPNPSFRGPATLDFCWNGRDIDGNTVPASEVQLRITIDTTAQPLRALPTPGATANATGYRQYTITGLSVPKGDHTVTVALVHLDGDGIAPPFAFTIRGGPMNPPRTVNVKP